MQYAPHMRHVCPEYFLKGIFRPFLPTTPRQDLTGIAPLQTTIFHTMSRCSSFTKCTDSEAACACVGRQLHGGRRIVVALRDFVMWKEQGSTHSVPESLLHYCSCFWRRSSGKTPQMCSSASFTSSVDDHENSTARMWSCRPARFFSSPHCLGKLLLSLCEPST